jgi:hypothetical protein
VGCFGQDWSSFQSTSLPTAGLAFVVVKATEGLTYTNPNGAAQVAHARNNDLVIGHYHYPHMANSPAAEADRFLGVAAPHAADFLVLDWEGYDNANKNVPFSTQVAYKKAWLAHVEAALPHTQTGTYANVDYLNKDPNGTYGDFLWIATAGRAPGQPGIAHPWLFHQYGASGIDRDYCPLTPAELKSWALAKEADVPLNDADLEAVALAVWGYQNKKAGDAHDMHQSLRNAEASAATAAKPAPVALTDAQVAAFAQALATNPAFVAAFATAVVDLEAKRLQS